MEYASNVFFMDGGQGADAAVPMPFFGQRPPDLFPSHIHLLGQTVSLIRIAACTVQPYPTVCGTG